MQLVIRSDGIVRCIYDESLDLRKLGSLSVTRGSSVEPNESGHWIADLAVVDGPKIGPFDHRSEALAAERKWLEDHWLTCS